MAEVTARDLDLLRIAYQFHFITIEITKTCVFSNRNVAQRRLATIEKIGYLRSFPLSGGRRGQPTKVYYLNGRLKAELGKMLGQDLDRKNIPGKPPENAFVTRHCLELNTVLSAFIAATRKRGYSFEFLPEYWVAPSGNLGILADESKDPANRSRMVRYRRDAVCCVGTERGKGLFEIEYDRGQEAVQSPGLRKITVGRKIMVFLESVKERRFERYGGPVFFDHTFNVSRLLLITTSEERLNNIARFCLETGTHGLVYLTTADKIRPDLLFGAIWTVPRDGNVETRALVRGT